MNEPARVQDWDDVHNFVDEVKATDFFERHISLVRHPLGGLMTRLDREIQQHRTTHMAVTANALRMIEELRTMIFKPLEVEADRQESLKSLSISEVLRISSVLPH